MIVKPYRLITMVLIGFSLGGFLGVQFGYRLKSDCPPQTVNHNKNDIKVKRGGTVDTNSAIIAEADTFNIVDCEDYIRQLTKKEIRKIQND